MTACFCSPVDPWPDCQMCNGSGLLPARTAPIPLPGDDSDESVTMTPNGQTPNTANQIAPAQGKHPDAIVTTSPGKESPMDITLVTPRFTRTPDMPTPEAAPSTLDEWRALSALSAPELIDLGFGNWDGGLYLIPGEWHSSIPAGLVVEDIFGDAMTAGVDHFDNDTRVGCPAYGFRIGPPTEGEEG